MYTTNSAEACYYQLHSAKAQIVLVENDTQLQKILQVKDRLPEIRAIIQYKGDPPEDRLEVLTVSRLASFNLRLLTGALKMTDHHKIAGRKIARHEIDGRSEGHKNVKHGLRNL